MKKYVKLLLLLICTATVFPGCSANRTITSSSNQKPVDSKELKKTLVVSNLNEKLEANKNIVYCGAFQLAWNELKENIVKQNIKMMDESEAVKQLNKELSTKKDISESSYVALAGYNKDGIVNKINKELKIKFKNQAPKVENELKSPDDIMAYAYINKLIKFKTPFYKFEDPMVFGSDNTNIKCFGIKELAEKDKKIANQVKVIDYQGPNSFIIKLSSENNQDDIYLAKGLSKSTLLDSVSEVKKRLSNGKTENIEYGQTLKIPYIRLNINHSFDELIGKKLLNKGFEEYILSKASQSIQFKLDEKGAELKSEAKIIGTKTAKLTRNYIFDTPFLLYVEQKGAKNPFLVLWIDNDEILVK